MLLVSAAHIDISTTWTGIQSLAAIRSSTRTAEAKRTVFMPRIVYVLTCHPYMYIDGRMRIAQWPLRCPTLDTSSKATASSRSVLSQSSAWASCTP
eukprot:1352475-Amorphochlora_amoeboformis.AAC.2